MNVSPQVCATNVSFCVYLSKLKVVHLYSVMNILFLLFCFNIYLVVFYMYVVYAWCIQEERMVKLDAGKVPERSRLCEEGLCKSEKSVIPYLTESKTVKRV